MAANEFEKKVQRAMDEFKLIPSGDVWQRVEQRIREDKRKRRIIFFILFSFIGLTLVGYGLYHFSVHSEKPTASNERGTNDRLQRVASGTQDVNAKVILFDLRCWRIHTS